MSWELSCNIHILHRRFFWPINPWPAGQDTIKSGSHFKKIAVEKKRKKEKKKRKENGESDVTVFVFFIYSPGNKPRTECTQCLYTPNGTRTRGRNLQLRKIIKKRV